ncbi:MBL fold metallo-hydrolase [Mollicutes bacterium LVI A0078]|nr:MBL fold metallo-hydrolase [Mollicutes bacterium LVI A0075]WOO91071.1 MBL fold metallo-hydrolase [Mollicutes bacterium LVI A0078]
MNIIKRFVLSDMGVNSFLLDCNGKTVLIDAPAGVNRVTSYLDQNDLKLDYVLITHAHFDHILGANELVAAGYIKEVYVSPNEIEMFTDNSEAGNLGGKYGLDIKFDGQIKSLEELDTVSLGLEVAYIEGHSIQSAVFIFNDEKIIFSGDTLFKDSIGRSDFSYGNYELLKDGINQKIMNKEDYKVYPGHGFATSTTLEKNNPLLG